MIRITTLARRGRDPDARLPEFVDRMNGLNAAGISYEIDGDALEYDVIDEAVLSEFDRDMVRFVDHDDVVPIRFIGRSTAVFVDSHYFATIDIDDLLGGSDHSLRMNLLHILVERFETPNYERRRRIFMGPHRRGIEREREYLRGVLGDPTITYTGERRRSARVYVFTFRSTRGYRIEHVFTTVCSRVTSELIVVEGGIRMTLPEFLARPAGAGEVAWIRPPRADAIDIPGGRPRGSRMVMTV